MAAAAGVEKLLGDLAAQHSRLLEDVAATSLRVLSEENRQLAQENKRLLEALTQAAAPPAPPNEPEDLPTELPAAPLRTAAAGEPLVARRLPAQTFGWTQPSAEAPLCLPADPPRKSALRSNSGLRSSTVTPLGARASIPGTRGSVSWATCPSPQGSGVDDAFGTLSMPMPGPRAGRTSAVATNSVLSRLNVKFKNRQRRRIRDLLKLNGKAAVISAEHLHNRVKAREPNSILTVEDVEELITEFGRIAQLKAGKSIVRLQSNAKTIAFDVLVDVLLLPDVTELVDPDLVERTEALMSAIMTVTVGEVIDDATRGALAKECLKEQIGERWESILNGFVVVSVLVSIINMGTSIDFHEDHFMWIVLEAVCASIFVAEVVIKSIMWGPRVYLCGPRWRWNLIDMGVTMLSLIELALSVAERLEGDVDEGKTTVSTANIGLVLRALRFTRVLRLVKLLHSPLLRELANMLVGCVIGVPSLLWVLVLFLIILFMTGLGFRIILGPSKDQDLISRCGLGDNLPTVGADPTCVVHLLYGEEFFSSVKMSMFTAFRFMIGDYSTRDGKSLAVIYSRAYGDRFHLAFCTGMIMVMFGLFNIITAIFVDTVVTGLKHNDVKRKYARQYERKYVQQKLMELLETAADCIQRQEQDRVSTFGTVTRTKTRDRLSLTNKVSLENRRLDDLTLTELDFMEVMDDPRVQAVLVDLDCAIHDPAAVFDTFDPGDSGEVTAAELVNGVLKLRGEPAKNDMVAAWVALRQLHEKLDSVQMMLIEVKHSGSGGGLGGSRQSADFGSLGSSAPRSSGSSDSSEGGGGASPAS